MDFSKLNSKWWKRCCSEAKTQEEKGGERETPGMIETMTKNRAPPEIIETTENLVMGGIEGKPERLEIAGT
uniref:Uncharacterized protein n=1 Tax=Sphaerodactylus townsendi TaxID=933632 RepID=A0ACB8GDU7_9SAUR